MDLSNLVSAIQLSVQGAGDALARASHESLARYFVDATAPADAKKILQDALREAAEAPEERSPEEVIKGLADSLHAASKALESGAGPLRPRTVAMEYPMMTREGPVAHTVHVPLLALAPMTGVQISRLTFRADLAVLVDGDGALQVSFAPPGGGGPPLSKEGGPEDEGGGAGGGGAAAARGVNTSIEIVVESGAPPEGLRRIVEGYERALRAQIPG
jgi:hypothetical protein